MPHVSLRVSEQEKELMENYAKLNNVSLSDAIKSIFFERLEDEYDQKIVDRYEKNPPEHFYSFEETAKKLGFDDEL